MRDRRKKLTIAGSLRVDVDVVQTSAEQDAPCATAVSHGTDKPSLCLPSSTPVVVLFFCAPVCFFVMSSARRAAAAFPACQTNVVVDMEPKPLHTFDGTVRPHMCNLVS